jgi:hypothetical protein
MSLASVRGTQSPCCWDTKSRALFAHTHTSWECCWGRGPSGSSKFHAGMTALPPPPTSSTPASVPPAIVGAPALSSQAPAPPLGTVRSLRACKFLSGRWLSSVWEHSYIVPALQLIQDQAFTLEEDVLPGAASEVQLVEGGYEGH